METDGRTTGRTIPWSKRTKTGGRANGILSWTERSGERTNETMVRMEERSYGSDERTPN